MGGTTLGLDLGTNSIGWALLEYDDNQQPQKLIACGSRIFQEAVEAKTGTPKNHARRSARAARKLVARRKQRRDKLLNLLLRNNLLPKDAAERNGLLLDNQDNNPYLLRKRGLDEKLEPHQFGRALYHLPQRRGFQSNRKAASDEDGKVKSRLLLCVPPYGVPIAARSVNISPAKISNAAATTRRPRHRPAHHILTDARPQFTTGNG